LRMLPQVDHFEKLGVRNSAEIVQFAIRNGLVT
jgi:DNA-binding CsgD family transcriptional regulator